LVEEGDGCQAPASAAPAPRVWRKAAMAASLLALASAGALALLARRTAAAATPSQTVTAHGLAEKLEAPAPSVKYGSAGQDQCPPGYSRIVEEATCRAAMPFIAGGDPDHFNGAHKEADWPRGCYRCKGARGCEDGVWFNPHSTGQQQDGASPICQQSFKIEEGGTLFMGDSDVDYWHTFRTAVPGAYNVGIGGNTCKDALKEIDALLASFKPAAVVLVCGENDLAGGASVAQTFERWTQVVGKIREAGARVVMMGTKPESYTRNLHKKYQAYDAMIRQYATSAAEEAAPAPVAFVDVFPAFKAMGNPDSLYDPSERPNYLHLGPPGYAKWNAWAEAAHSGLLDCVVWEGGACKAGAPAIVALKATANECPAGFEKFTTKERCHAVPGLLGGGLEFEGAEDESGWPAGCYLCRQGVEGCTAGVWFNGHAKGAAKQGARVICTKSA